jgi:hypothetical protein
MNVRFAGVALLLTVMAVAPAVGQQEPSTPPQPGRQLSLGLDILNSPRYEAARELRLALWDSPMSRLEFGAARELLAARYPGPVGTVTPASIVNLPLRLNFSSPGEQKLFLAGPWSAQWSELSWQEKVATSMETGLFLTLIAKAIGSIR